MAKMRARTNLPASGPIAHSMDTLIALTSGKLLSIKNNGVEKFSINFDGGSAPGGGVVVSKYLFGSATYDPASLADGVGATTTITVTGAALGDYVLVSFSLDLQGIGLTGYVSATNTVAVRFQNESTATVDLASGTLRALVVQSTNAV